MFRVTGPDPTASAELVGWPSGQRAVVSFPAQRAPVNVVLNTTDNAGGAQVS